MSLWVQNLLVLLLVLACAGIVGAQVVRTLLGRKNTMGKCCAKGCEPAPAKPQAENRIAFIPSDLLRRK